MPRKKTKQLSTRHVKAAQGLAAGKSKVAAAVDAGFSETTAKDHPELIWNQDTLSYSRKLLDRHGLTDDFMAAKARELLDAGEVKIIRRKGAPPRKITIPDNATQRDVWKHLTQMRGLFKSETDMRAVVKILMDAVNPVVLEFVPTEKQDHAFNQLQRNLLATGICG